MDFDSFDPKLPAHFLDSLRISHALQKDIDISLRSTFDEYIHQRFGGRDLQQYALIWTYLFHRTHFRHDDHDADPMAMDVFMKQNPGEDHIDAVKRVNNELPTSYPFGGDPNFRLTFGKYKGLRLRDSPKHYLVFLSQCVPVELLPSYRIKTPRMNPFNLKSLQPILCVAAMHVQEAIEAHKVLYEERDRVFSAKLDAFNHDGTKKCAKCARAMPKIIGDWDDRRFHKNCYETLVSEEAKAYE